MYWLALGFFLLICEFLTNTFYLLVLCVAFIATGLIEWLFQTPFYLNVIIASVMSIIGVFLVKKINERLRLRVQDQVSDDLDLGQYVEVKEIEPSGLVVVYYRGTQWQAKFHNTTEEAHPVEGSVSTRAKIIGKEANILIIETVC